MKAVRVLFDFSELRGRIVARFGSCEAFAKAIDLSKAQLSDRLNNKVPFKPSEIPLICKLLDIAKEEIGRYFFTPKV